MNQQQITVFILLEKTPVLRFQVDGQQSNVSHLMITINNDVPSDFTICGRVMLSYFRDSQNTIFTITKPDNTNYLVGGK